MLSRVKTPSVDELKAAGASEAEAAAIASSLATLRGTPDEVRPNPYQHPFLYCRFTAELGAALTHSDQQHIRPIYVP